MLRQRSKSSFGKVYSELSPDDNDETEYPSSPVGFMWPSSTKSSAHHLENISLNFATQQLSSSPQLFCDAPEHSGDMEAGPHGHGGLASRRNRSRLTVRVDPLCSPMETKEDPHHYQHQQKVRHTFSPHCSVPFFFAAFPIHFKLLFRPFI
jgi:hypothetical protein